LALATAKIARIAKIKKSKLLSWSRANFVDFAILAPYFPLSAPVVHSKGLAPPSSALERPLYLY
jgi:hypothetical protein